MKALKITSYTLVCTDDQRPQQNGNCFSIKTEDGQEYRVVNFNYENLKALEKLGLTWPVEFEPLGTRCAIIMDPRIGERWYNYSYCEICCPRDLLPITQKQRHLRDIARGIRKELPGATAFYLTVKAEFP